MLHQPNKSTKQMSLEASPIVESWYAKGIKLTSMHFPLCGKHHSLVSVMMKTLS